MSVVKNYLAGKKAGYISLKDLIVGVSESNDCSYSEAALAIASVIAEHRITTYKMEAFSAKDLFQLADAVLVEASEGNNFNMPINSGLTDMFADDIPF
ncbi:hypothetical protein [Pseudomonas chlororaphis]|uniref:hypothetical protein n=1 Tax=Pseudomonas chlororaphis TaxID=587753 RepID=UPI0011CE518C|nr:hypothetical protein [Pseudomonas chlororaphis]